MILPAAYPESAEIGGRTPSFHRGNGGGMCQTNKSERLTVANDRSALAFLFKLPKLYNIY